jgi:Protein of unknown function (DUF3137)
MELDSITNELELRKIIEDESENFVDAVRTEVGGLESEYISARKEQKWGVLLVIGAFLLPYLFSFVAGQTFLVFSILTVMVICLVKGFKLIFGKLALINQYNNCVNRIIFTKAFSILGLDGRLVVAEEEVNLILKKNPAEKSRWQIFLRSLKVNGSPDLVATLGELETSELITEPHNTNQIDNSLEINYRDFLVRISELDIKHVTGSGKNRSTKNIFHGYFARVSLKKALSGKTFISTEGDKDGFGNISFWNNNTKETVLEWNEFEDLLHVATTDETEARYILTPNFMHDLHSWWKGQKDNIRLSFIGNNMYIIFPDNQIRINQTIEKIDRESIVEYTYSIARPLWYVMRLIDDVRL